MRADKFFAERFGSRTKAAEAIEKGWVLVNGKKIRPKDEVSDTDQISFEEVEEQYVSNGGYKLARAFSAFPFDCTEKTFADIGASTGGFTDCLLQRGAKRVFAIDVGESLLHERLKEDSRVLLYENTNARYLKKEDFPCEIDGVVTDVSFISLRLILPSIQRILSESGSAFVLVKPQFECEKKNIGKSGIVHPSAHAQIVKKVLDYCTECNLYPHGVVNAPIRKGKNIEYVLYLKRTPQEAQSAQEIVQDVQRFVERYKQGTLV